jgi:hypothetical protein
MDILSRSYETLRVRCKEAEEWGLVDACEEDSENLLRLWRISKPAITRKRYASSLDGALAAAKPRALQANLEVFPMPTTWKGSCATSGRASFPGRLFDE